MSFLRLDGSTAVAERQQMIDKFQSPKSKVFAFLLSTRAGGQGINLTAADTVIIHDLDWNPQLDRQAEDRAHRLGQKNEVSVYRLVTAGSVEESIVKMQKRKKTLGSAVLGDEKDAVQEVQEDDDDVDDGKKIDATMMSKIIDNALGLCAK